MNRLVLALSFAALLTGCLSTDSGKTHTSSKELRAIGTAPEFDLQRIAGGNLRSADLKGKVVVVDFWASWCDPCKKEIPDYNKLADSMAGKDAAMIGIALDSGSFEKVKEAVGELGIQYPVGFGKEGIDEQFGGLRGYPTTFVVGKDWKIYKKYEGEYPNKQELLKKDIEALLNREESGSSD